MPRSRLLLSFLALAGLLVGLLPGSLGAQPPSLDLSRRVVQIVYGDHLQELAARLDVWEVHPEEGILVALVSPAEEAALRAQGYTVTIVRIIPDGIQVPLDPRFYYFDDEYPNANGLYMVDFLQQTDADYPGLVELFDIGNAWQGENGGYNRDLWMLRITNEDPAYGDIADKPTFVLHADIHAREVATPELAIRYIKYLTSGYLGEGGYGLDADVTWLVDWNVVYVMVTANPDGHRVDEENTSAMRRKNMDNDDGCGDPNSWGVDLNRNHNFKWGCCGGSSGDPCAETYRGVARSSEPETFYFQNFITQNNILRDQNGPNGPDEFPPAAPPTTTGILLTLHSYADEVLWPWGFTPFVSPNDAELTTIGRKLAFYNGFQPTGLIGYDVDGDTHDWSYGQLGVASFTFEVGSNGGSCGGFFPAYGCLDGIDGMSRNFWAENRPAFLYMHKIARAPYLIAYGPDAIDLAAVPPLVTPGNIVEIRATIADQRYGSDPQRPAMAAEYFVGAPGDDGTGTPMDPVDGAWGDVYEAVTATLDTTGLPIGTHYVLVHGRNDQGQWGPYTAVFVYVVEPGVAPVIEGHVREAETAVPVAGALVTAGIFQDTTDATGYYSMTVLSGTYDMTAVASGYAPASASGVVAHDYEVVQQDFDLFSYCDIFTDNVEAGNPGWTADWPWAIVTETAHSPTHSWTESPGRDYYSFMNTSLTSPVFDLGNYQGMALDFWHIYELAAGDYSYIEYSTDGGASWTQVASYNGISPWTRETIYFPPALDNQPQARLRFRFESDGAGGVADGWHVDDIVLQGGGPGCLPCDPVGALDFGYTPSAPLVGEVVAFTGTATGTMPILYTWEFGDGATAGGITATHAYTAAGTYTVTLTAENCAGAVSVAQTLTVVLPCTGVEIVDVTPEVAGCAVTLTAELTGTAPFAYLWAFGDGMTSTVPMPTHTYTQSGTYSATLEAWNCADVGHDTYAFTVQVECAAPRWVVFLPIVFK